MVAHANTIAVMNNANATIADCVAGAGGTARISTDAKSTIDRMPTPEIGLFDAPINPAMYPQIPAIMNPPNNTNGTAISVSVPACGARTVARAKLKDSHAATTRQATVSATIHCGDRSRSVSRRVPEALDADSVLASPPITGFASRASV